MKNCPFLNYTYFSILIAQGARKTPVSAQPDLSIDFNPLRPRQSAHRSKLKRQDLPAVLGPLPTPPPVRMASTSTTTISSG